MHQLLGETVREAGLTCTGNAEGETGIGHRNGEKVVV